MIALENKWRILVAIGVLSAIPRPGWVATPCLAYEVVSLTGRLVRQTYAGPPDYESVTKGDAAQVIWVLVLDRHVCVVDPNPSLPKEYYEREVQLVLDAGRQPQYQHLLGEKVIATGKLLPGGARYDKRLVLAASEIEKTGVLP